MLSALLAAGIWLLIATVFGWSVSTTHSIVGSIVGLAAVCISVDAVHWLQVGKIVSSWFISPIVAGILSFSFTRVFVILFLPQKIPLPRQGVMSLHIFFWLASRSRW
jgi:PiT family inorganic phosphate transporter